jgi:enamine deaminase RidA (YjgF/YER057c/UK114 family)
MSKPSRRRDFLRDTLLVAAGVTTGSVMTSDWFSALPVATGAQNAGATAEARLRELDIALPAVPTPVAVYVPAVLSGKMLYTSGTGPRQADGTYLSGKVGKDMSVEEGYEAARLVGLNVLSSIRNTLGSLDRVVRLVKVLGMVNCTADFTKQPQVINGFSELMVAVFGEENGKAARSAVGMNALPSNIPVEIEAIFEVR